MTQQVEDFPASQVEDFPASQAEDFTASQVEDFPASQHESPDTLPMAGEEELAGEELFLSAREEGLRSERELAAERDIRRATELQKREGIQKMYKGGTVPVFFFQKASMHAHTHKKVR